MGRLINELTTLPSILSLVILSLMFLLLYMVVDYTAEAGHGCSSDYFHVHWERSSNPRTNGYRHSISLWEDQGIDYASAVDNAAGNWNDSQESIDFNKITSGTPDHYVFIKDDPNDPGWGSTSSYPDKCTGITSHFSYADVTLNSDAIEYDINNNSIPTTLRRKVASHEFGHAVGLAHPSVSTATPAIMHQDWNGYYWVRTRDIEVISGENLYLHLD